jgi:hypothetical protein
MLFKLNDPTKFAPAAKLDAKLVKAMVDAYRKHPDTKPTSLKFAHFEVDEILQLFIDNKIIESYVRNPNPIAGSYGLKIYIGNHYDMSTCPTNASDYVGFNTTILCNTVMMNAKLGEFHDLLKDNDTVALPVQDKVINADGYAIDQTYICPTTCPKDCVLVPSDPSEPDYTGLCVNDIGL